jgi:hypothetical protein
MPESPPVISARRPARHTAADDISVVATDAARTLIGSTT